MSADPTPAEVGALLLARLRRMAGMHSVEFAEPPSRISGGFETLIFGFRLARAPAPFDRALVLRRFRETDAGPRARFEAAVHGAIAQQGYPVPRVLDWSEDAAPLGAPFLVLERIEGEILMPRIFDPALFRFPAVLAREQLRLHALDPAPVLRAIEAAGFGAARVHPDAELEAVASHARRLGLAGLEPGVAWLRAKRPAPAPAVVVCHGDFHPLNVLAKDGRVTGVLDWTLRHMCIADPAYDVGATIAILSTAPADLPRFLRGPALLVRRHLVRDYQRHYAAGRALAAGVVGYYEALRALGILLEAGEHRLADAGRVARPQKPTAYADAWSQQRVVGYFRDLTGVSVALPD
jgi:aminoglycoside phosphotransferase (APT) family kinase protein